MANLADLIERAFGTRTEHRVNRQGTTVGVAAGIILRSDPRRLAATIVNLSAVAIYVAPGREVSATKGIRLAPSGGSLILVWDEEFELLGWEWWALADAAASAVFTSEVLGR